MTTSRHAVVGVRERIVAAAYELFTRRGVRDVDTDEVVVRAGIAPGALAEYFPTKDELVLAVLRRREELWTFALVEEQSRTRGSTPVQQLLAIFDVFEEWFVSRDFDACTFINVLLEMGADHPIGRAGIEHLGTIRDIVRGRAEQAGLTDPDDFARTFHILMKGSIIAAAEGDEHAARRAKRLGRTLIEAHRPPGSAPLDDDLPVRTRRDQGYQPRRLGTYGDLVGGRERMPRDDSDGCAVQ
ncbi:HTH-type transcriptional regulator RutR [Nocardia otitidiscaviarum]|uniref:HTH-type transcriptional regulator RutR n=1 Tax=Nocardia otitidiscaviarum TaxID=1823 RepID=A0A378YPC1_9NOCA|nr:HTH-type transcriptional regulator RutR [Nocardia otitidiscaviarum]